MKKVAEQDESTEKLRKQRKAANSSKAISSSLEGGKDAENSITR
jgi:hypothetical protein